MDDKNLKAKQDQPAQDQPVSVGSVQKEKEPTIQGETGEYLSRSEQEPSLHEEFEKAGVEKVSDKTPLTKEQQGLGIEDAGEVVEPETEPKGKVELPLTNEEIKEAEKQSNSSSVKWLMLLLKKVLKKIKG